MSIRESIRHKFFALPVWKRAALLFASVVLVGLFIVGAYASGREALSRWRFSRDTGRLSADIREWKARAQAAELRAAALDGERARLDRELTTATARAEAAEAALAAARTLRIKARENYDQIRNRPLSAVPADADGLCAKLAGLGFACNYAGTGRMP